MAGNYNYCCLIGNLTRDVEVRYTQSQVTIAQTAIAVNRTYGGNTETLFMDIIAFGKLAEVVKQYGFKGESVMAAGRLNLNQWTAQDGSKRSRVELIVESFQVLEFKQQPPQPGDRQYYENQTPYSNDDIPF
jgi:single-strand DNA-binding protein